MTLLSVRHHLALHTRQCEMIECNVHHMVRNASPTPKRRGRPPGFERDAVVSAAMDAFWSKGFRATTLSDLEEATGVDRSTLYNFFDGKDGLYRSATAAYVNLAEQWLFEPLLVGSDGIADIIEFMDRLDETYRSSANTRGCLIVNGIASGADHEATDRYLRSLQDGLQAALQRAAAAGETDPNKIAQRCQLLSAAIIGINLLDCRTPDNAATLALINSARSEVATWDRPD